MTEDTPPLSSNPKRPASPPASPDPPPSKKVRLSFSPKDFRKQLKTDQKTLALQRFLLLIEETNQQCISTYLENGGSPMEILQSTEGETGASPLLVFNILNRILLQISAKLSRFQSAAYDACRYLLNTYLTQINKMLGLSSSMNERVVVLKLLTTIATCSVVLAKDVLLNVNFNPTNLELLTKFSEGKNEARGALIHFITAFLVDGHFSAFSVLLEKRGLLTSIVNGLQYDDADTVVLVVTAMKTHILENTSVSKTAKMKTFNTQVVRDIVNLYNWRGPTGLENKKNKTKIHHVDEVEKSKVSEAVHSFLLALCTSHKLGVVFKDPLIGLGKRQNLLIYTVLESLVRPWEHSYASDLVIKICKACPDLVKTIWTRLKLSLEPRWAPKWLQAVEFAQKLLDELEINQLEALNTQQVAQVILVLMSPVFVLKVLVPSKTTVYPTPGTKYQVMKLLLKMLTKLEEFLKSASAWKFINFPVLREIISNHISRNFPGVDSVLTDWNQTDEEFELCDDYLEVALDLLAKYKVLAPKIFELGNSNLDVRSFLGKTSELGEESRLRLQVKAVEVFVEYDPSLFKPNSDFFKEFLLFSTEYYHDSKDGKVLGVLREVLQNSGVFDGCLSEIDFWIDGFLNLKHYDTSVAVFLCDLIRETEKHGEYQKELFESKANFSSLVLSLGDFTSKMELPKSVKNYIGFVLVGVFHVQDDMGAFLGAISKFGQLSESLGGYFSSWGGLEVAVLSKNKGRLMEVLQTFSGDFLQGSFQDFDFDLYPNQKLNLLQALVFYLTSLIKGGLLSSDHQNNSLKFLKFLINSNVFEDDRCVKAILGNVTLLQNFTVLNHEDFSTKFVLEMVKSLKPGTIGSYLGDFQRRVVANIVKMFKKPEKYQKQVISSDILEIMALDYDHCRKLLTKFVGSLDNKGFFSVACYCLNRMAKQGLSYSLEPLDSETISDLSRFVSVLLKDQTPNLSQLSAAFYNYLKTFPHSLESVEVELFESLVSTPEYNKDNLVLSEFLLDRKPECLEIFEKNLPEICSKRSFILGLLDPVLRHYQNKDTLLEKVFTNLEPHLLKALQKPHKAGQHFQNRHETLGVLVEKFMKVDGFGHQVLKFETTELFHVYLLKKVFKKVQKNDKVCGNILMTFVHLLMGLLKQKTVKSETLTQVGGVVLEFLKEEEFDGSGLGNNETLKMFCKLSLKFGVAGEVVLVQILSEVVKLCLGVEDTKLLLEMLFSHSLFLDAILGEVLKLHLVGLWRTICEKFPELMERNHLPVLLSCYKATKSEESTLKLIKMYESRPDQTKFFDFKPFLWGRAAVSHYSVRSDPQKALWRQPKVSDVLNSLQWPTIVSTITGPSDPSSYDLDFFLPLFTHLLAPENPVPTYRFTKTGALALALTGFRGSKTQRLASCTVLQRFYFHLEAKQNGKDNLLWLRLIEAVCKGVAVLDDFQINNFVGVFLARTALILTQPLEVMYVPLSQYLSAKDTLDFRSIPELYTFLHSPHVECKQHKTFILEVVRDGLKSEKDFTTLLKSMGFKLISELCSSVVCDVETKVLVLEIFEECCGTELGVKVLCGSLGFLTQLSGLIAANLHEGVVMRKLLSVLLKIVQVDSNRQRNFLIFLSLMELNENFRSDSNSLEVYYRTLKIIVERFPEFLTQKHMETLLANSKDLFCGYLLRYRCKFLRETDFSGGTSQFLRLLFYCKMKTD